MSGGPVLSPDAIVLPPYVSPNGGFIPNPDALYDSATVIMAAAIAGLRAYGRDQDYPQQIITHGELVIPTKAEGLIGLYLPELHVGRAGQQQFQWDDNSLGRYGFRVVRYAVEIWRRWPTVRGGAMGSGLPEADQLVEPTKAIWRDGFIVWATLNALASGAVKPAAGAIPQDHLLVSPMTPVAARGGQAGWRILLELQL